MSSTNLQDAIVELDTEKASIASLAPVAFSGSGSDIQSGNMGLTSLAITGGTLVDGATVFSAIATMPAVITAGRAAIQLTALGNGSSAFNNSALLVNYAGNYTGPAISRAINASNANASTGNTLIAPPGSNNATGNYGTFAQSIAITIGLNIGASGFAQFGNLNVGLFGAAQFPKAAATNIGVAGTAINTGTTPVQIGGWFSLNQQTIPTVNAALIADNGVQTDPIFRARDNGTDVFVVGDGGVLTATQNINGNANFAFRNLNAGSAAFTLINIGNDTNPVAASFLVPSSANVSFGLGTNSLNILSQVGVGFIVNGALTWRIDSAGDLIGQASASPNIQFVPTSGSTKVGVLKQTADTFIIAGGNTPHVSVDLVSGNVTMDGALSVPRVLVGGLAPSMLTLSFIGVNLNSAADQPVTFALPQGCTRYMVQFARLMNGSAPVTTASGGVYTGAGKTGSTIVANQALTGLSNITVGANGSVANLAVTNNATAFYQALTLYFNLTTLEGVARTADLHLDILVYP